MANKRNKKVKVCGTCQFWNGKRQMEGKYVKCISSTAKCVKYNERLLTDTRENGHLICKNYLKWDELD